MVCSNSFCCWLVDGWGTMTAAVVGCGCDRVVGRMTKLKQIWKVGILCCRLRRELVGGVSNESLSRSDLSPSTASHTPLLLPPSVLCLLRSTTDIPTDEKCRIEDRPSWSAGSLYLSLCINCIVKFVQHLLPAHSGIFGHYLPAETILPGTHVLTGCRIQDR